MWRIARSAERCARSCARSSLIALAVASCQTSIGGGGAGGSTSDAGAPPADAAPGIEQPDAANAPVDAALVPPDARPPCAEGDLRIEDPGSGACYMFFAAGLDWDQAEIACIALGGHLAAVTSLAENALLSQIAPDSQDIWIGASDADSEKSFAWSSGETFGFDHWRSGEPNDGGDDGEDCAAMEGDNNVPGEGCLWDDRPCDDPRPYLCERP